MLLYDRQIRDVVLAANGVGNDDKGERVGLNLNLSMKRPTIMWIGKFWILR